MATIHAAGIEVSAKTLGAELTSIRSAEGTEYLWHGDPKFWARQSPLLFPIVGALPGGVYTHRGATYKLANHGFARECEFVLVREKPSEMVYELRSSEKTLAQYPFPFAVRVTYKVRKAVLTVGYSVRNSGAETMIFSIGAHPAFRAPIVADERREDFDLIFEKKEDVRRQYLTADNVRSGEAEPFLRGEDRVAVTPELFDRGAIVLIDHVSRQLTLRGRKSGRYVRLRFDGFPYLGIWSPKGDTPFVCLEPWYGVMPLADSSPELSSKEGCVSLAAGREFRAAYRIEIG
jgi:galactose mutarotase-like enzyme